MDSTGPAKARKKSKNQSPEVKFQLDLTDCSRRKDLLSAITLCETAVSEKLKFNQQHFNTLLYLCSTAISDPSLKESAVSFGFRVYNLLQSIGVIPNEATVTAVARLAAAKRDGDSAFELVKTIGKYKVTPRLRTYDPALFCFCESLEVDKAYEVEQHMSSAGVELEEPQISVLLKVSSDTGKGDKVYEYLHKLRRFVKCVSESTAKIIEDWFCSEKASDIGESTLDVGLIREAILSNGGGWHGKGWIGKGNWVVKRTNVYSNGKCCCCAQQLVCVDISCAETDNFAQSLAALAIEREAQPNFISFQEWLEVHNHCDAIVDGANVGLYQQNFADSGFNLPQVEAVVKELCKMSRGKWPLVFWHNKRTRASLDNSSHRKVVEEWIDKGVLYSTPNGSNDDWYWLYAAVKLKCLLITNDEMRDHIFELLGNDLFLRWKEKHQIRYTFVKGQLRLEMPPPYSVVIQESETGSWHVPIAGNDSELERTWLCVTRPGVSTASDIAVNGETFENIAAREPCASISVTLLDSSVARKRKERPSSTS
ncbi:proteinaceous RNase P 2-like [Cucumis melo var. makuwa]|uniref:Mitochondrial ribonuclease P catalytic subunit n=2 Tax=Cucumis melo TaxID=3656 RepID=A0A1S3B5V6_CUCME|nr:proteinaceous RNase P 2-like isoform X1 [Cucumis melo]KAA0041248.1 proteinaceous RNase P 2-like [Cucumis melo var. makuwa]TYK16047.1 proteinaceous RNase P 2-like [Cucumis melo var. makuwa]